MVEFDRCGIERAAVDICHRDTEPLGKKSLADDLAEAA
jgi:hypothetical protein